MRLPARLRTHGKPCAPSGRPSADRPVGAGPRGPRPVACSANMLLVVTHASPAADEQHREPVLEQHPTARGDLGDDEQGAGDADDHADRHAPAMMGMSPRARAPTGAGFRRGGRSGTAASSRTCPARISSSAKTVSAKPRSQMWFWLNPASVSLSRLAPGAELLRERAAVGAARDVVLRVLGQRLERDGEHPAAVAREHGKVRPQLRRSWDASLRARATANGFARSRICAYSRSVSASSACSLSRSVTAGTGATGS